MTITSDRLLAGVKRRVTMPASQVLLQDSDILQLADDMIRIKIIPLIDSTNQDYLIYMQEVPIIAGQTLYDIPYRAVARSLRELKIRDPNKNIRNVPLVALEDAQYFINNSYTSGFYFQSDKIRLVPDVPQNIPQSNMLQIWYRCPPSALVPTSNACLVTGINGANITVASVPSNITALSIIDFIQGISGNTIYGMDKAILGINGNILTFNLADVPTNLAIGDWISLAQTSPVINFIPDEIYPYIETRVAQRVLQIIGDFDGMAVVKEEVKEEKDNAMLLFEPRIEGEPALIVNRTGLVRGNKMRQRTWLYGSS